MTSSTAPSPLSLPFWPERDIVSISSRIVLLFKGDVNPVGRFPGAAPGFDELARELSRNRTCWVSVMKPKEGQASPEPDRVRLRFLAGRLIVTANVWYNDKRQPRLSLQRRGGIEFATNVQRARTLAEGCSVNHRGFVCVAGSELRQLEFNGDSDVSAGFWQRGDLVEQLLGAVKTKSGGSANAGPLVSPGEQAVLGTLRAYVDAEYEQEEAAARALPPFFYTALRAEARTHVYRQFFRMQLDTDSAERLRAERATRLLLETGEGEGVPLQVDSEVEANGSVLVSIARQIDASVLPKSGQLAREATPTTRNVRLKVIDLLAEGQHPWLTKVAAREYRYPGLDVPPAGSIGKLNPSQAQAVVVGAKTPDYLLVLGPPGTGKTTVILDWVQRFVTEGKRVLIATQNNKAVDNVLERLAKRPDIECARLGNENKVMGSVQDLLIEVKAHAIQTKLAERGAASAESVAQAITWLTAVRAIIGEYLRANRSALEAKSEVDRLLVEGQSLVARRDESGEALGRGREALLHHQQRFDELGEKLSGSPASAWAVVWLWLTRWWLKLSLWRARRGVASAAGRLSALVRGHEQAGARVAEFEPRVTAATKRLAAERARRDAALPAKPPLASRLCLDPEALPLDPARASQLLSDEIARVQSIHSNLDKFRGAMRGERQEGLLQLLLSLVDVVGATCIGIASRPQFRDTVFDVAIIDESGQIQLHNLMVPLARAPKTILVGDHMQLPPVVDDALSEELNERGTDTDFLHKSWFEKLWGEAPATRKVMLDTQFRCPAVISDYISEAFYESKYYAGQGMADKRPLLPLAKSCFLFIDTSEHPDRGEKSRRNESRTEVVDNPLETRLVVAVLRYALSQHPDLFDDPEGVGVIVPYKNHVERIQSALQQELRRGTLPPLRGRLADLVASVDSFQGQERRLIIFTMTRANSGGQVGFLADARRLNVAMTRAKQQLVLIADAATLTRRYEEGRVDADFKLKMQALTKYVRERAHYMSAAEGLRVCDGPRDRAAE